MLKKIAETSLKCRLKNNITFKTIDINSHYLHYDNYNLIHYFQMENVSAIIIIVLPRFWDGNQTD